jgi:hypothetical protein
MYLHTRVYFPCPVPPVSRKKVGKDSLRYKITLLWLAYFIYIGSHRFGPEIARQIRKSDVEMEKEQGDIEALDSIRFFLLVSRHLFCYCLQ